jgi:hypothetical protein
MLGPNNFDQTLKKSPLKKQPQPQTVQQQKFPTHSTKSTPTQTTSGSKPSKDVDSLDLLRTVPEDNGFHFYIADGKPTGITAVSMVDFGQKLGTVPVQSVDYHYPKGNFQTWFNETIGDHTLAQRISNTKKGLAGEDLRKALLKVVLVRIAELQMSPKDLRVALYLAIYTSVILAIIIYSFIAVWPSNPTDSPLNSTVSRNITFYATGIHFPIGSETSILFIMMFAGIIGACVFSLFAISHHVAADKDFSRLWAAWYLLRPFVGGGLALIFYLVLRGGVLNLGASVNSLNVVALTAASALVGMFSEQAMHKLQDVADGLFGEAPDTAKPSTAAQSGTSSTSSTTQ